MEDKLSILENKICSYVNERFFSSKSDSKIKILKNAHNNNNNEYFLCF